MSSIYTSGDGAVPPVLAGRDELLRRLLLGLNSAATVGRSRAEDIVLIGPTGVGKTATLAAYTVMAETGGFEVVQLHAAADRFSLTKSLAQHAAMGIEGIADVDSQTLAAALAKVADNVRGDKPHGGLLVTFDDLHLAAPADLQLLTDTLSCLSAEHPEAAVAFAGAGTPRLKELLKTSGVVAPNGPLTLEQLPVVLPLADAMYGIVEPARRIGVSWHPQALATLMSASNRYPVLLQVYADAIWAQADGAHLIDSDHAEAGVPIGTAEIFGSRLGSRWDQLSDPEREYLAALAISGGQAPNMAITNTLGRRSGYDFVKLRDGLIDAGDIYAPRPGHAAFCVPAFGPFILERYEAAREGADTELLSLAEMSQNKQPTSASRPTAKPAPASDPADAAPPPPPSQDSPPAAPKLPPRRRWNRRRGTEDN